MSKKNKRPIVLVSSYPPRLCGIATFAEEAREFIQKANPDREVVVISHADGCGDGVYPIIDMKKRDWWKPVHELIEKLKPYAVHFQHEYGLYNFRDERGHSDGNQGFLALLDAITDWPIIVEPHTVHGRLTDFEANFIYNMCQRADVVLFKCAYQKWRLDWTFIGYGWPTPRNIMVVPHGARSDMGWPSSEIPRLREELGLHRAPLLSDNLVGLVGWIQSNKRWDILTSMWDEIATEIEKRTGQKWDLLAAGTMRDPADERNYMRYKKEVELLEKKGRAHYFEFVPRGEIYYKVMAVCDFIVLPSQDETQSGTLARIIALNKPYITTAPMEGLTSQTLECDGGFLFTTKEMLRRKVINLASNEELRMEMKASLAEYLRNVVAWENVAKQYNTAYELARSATEHSERIELPLEF